MKRLSQIITIALVLAAGSVWAQSGSDNSLLYTAESPELTWNDCPPLMPEGCKIAFLQGDPAKKNLDIFFKVPGGYEIPNHYHTSPERMILVSGQLDVTYQGEETSTMKVGSYAYGPPEKPHVATCAPGDPCIIFIAFVDPLDAFPFEGTK